MDPRKNSLGEMQVAPADTTVAVPVDMDDPTRVLKVGSQPGIRLQKELINFLQANLDEFAWTHSDMYGISPEIACHAVNIDPKFTSVRQDMQPWSGAIHCTKERSE